MLPRIARNSDGQRKDVQGCKALNPTRIMLLESSGTGTRWYTGHWRMMYWCIPYSCPKGFEVLQYTACGSRMNGRGLDFTSHSSDFWCVSWYNHLDLGPTSTKSRKAKAKGKTFVFALQEVAVINEAVWLLSAQVDLVKQLGMWQ